MPGQLFYFLPLCMCLILECSTTTLELLLQKYQSGHYCFVIREVATITYRSGPEWEQRFGRKRIEDQVSPNLCPEFEIESYLDYQVTKCEVSTYAHHFPYSLKKKK